MFPVVCLSDALRGLKFTFKVKTVTLRIQASNSQEKSQYYCLQGHITGLRVAVYASFEMFYLVNIREDFTLVHIQKEIFYT